MRVDNLKDLPDHIQKQIREKEGTVRKTATDQTIFVDQLPPGLNGDTGLMRMHWTKYQKLRDTWVTLIRAENPERHEGRVNITYTRKSVRMMDPDNVSASFKPIGDALEKLGVIEDDSFKTIKKFDVRWEKANSYMAQGIRIEITNVE